LDGHLIPSIIMWRSAGGTNFVIDGAHRLSALMAWVHNDYGDGPLSTAFFGPEIPTRQKFLARKTRELMDQQVGSYASLQWTMQHQDTPVDRQKLLRAKNMLMTKLDLQWVEGSASVAENSFFRINGFPSVIDQTELILIKARRKPNAIATRALMRAG